MFVTSTTVEPLIQGNEAGLDNLLGDDCTTFGVEDMTGIGKQHCSSLYQCSGKTENIGVPVGQGM